MAAAATATAATAATAGATALALPSEHIHFLASLARGGAFKALR
jgi:hypothetical protein